MRVSETSNRVGLRLCPLDGAPIERRVGELDPQGMVLGAVQVPPEGQPVVLLPDHATHGGYPVVAVVIAADRHLLGRCRPGDEVLLIPVSLLEARDARRRLLRQLVEAPSGRYPLRAGVTRPLTGRVELPDQPTGSAEEELEAGDQTERHHEDAEEDGG